MSSSPLRATAALLLLAAWGCAARTPGVFVPPQIDLKSHEVIGVVEFSSPSESPLGSLATRRFTESARRDQGLVRIVDLGTETEMLQSVGRRQLDAEALRELGRKHGVSTIVLGDVTISKVRPNVSLDATLRSGGLSAEVDATLAVRMVEADSGASLWSGSARATHSVANVNVWGGTNVAFNAADPQKAYGGLVDALVEQVAQPFHGSWRRP